MSQKQSFVTFEHRLNRLVFSKIVCGSAKADGMDLGEKQTQSLFSEFLHPLDELFVNFLKNIQNENCIGRSF